MKRKRRTPKQRIAICEAHGWICHLTGIKIDPVRDKWEIEHVIPLAGGGEDVDENCAPVLAWAHKEKTVQDVKRIAKGKRVRQKHLGAKKTSSRPIPGSRRSGVRKRMDGTVEKW